MMSRRLTLAGALVLCAMAFVAAAASNAAAFGQTAFTCVKSPGGFADEDCSLAGGLGEFSHAAIAVGLSTQLTLKEIPLTSTTLKAKVGLVNVTVTANEVECLECMTANHEEALEMDVSGTGRLRYTSATINVSGCSITGGEIKTEPLKFTTISTISPIRTEFSPVSGTTVEVIHLSGAGCPLGSTITVAGHAIWTTTGAKVNIATVAGELTVGSQQATLSSQMTASTGTTGLEHHPLAYTSTP